MSEYVFLYITTPNKEEAQYLGKSLVEQKFAACVNIIPGMESIYHWEGKIESSEEVVIIVKTTKALEQEVIDFVKENHSYDCPCVVSLDINNGYHQFLKWLEESTS